MNITLSDEGGRAATQERAEHRRPTEAAGIRLAKKSTAAGAVTSWSSRQ